MTNTTPVYVRIDSNLKESAEKILNKIGITPNAAISMFYSQIILQKGLPFDVRIPTDVSFNWDNLSKEEILAKIEEGIESVEKDGTYSSEEVYAMLSKRVNRQ